jgi:hypothetical protein
MANIEAALANVKQLETRKRRRRPTDEERTETRKKERTSLAE